MSDIIMIETDFYSWGWFYSEWHNYREVDMWRDWWSLSASDRYGGALVGTSTRSLKEYICPANWILV